MSYREKRPRTSKLKRTPGAISMRKRVCRLCTEKQESVDYKDNKRLEKFITDRGKMLSSRISGNCAKHQRMLSDAIKKARFISLIPYTQE